MMEVNLARATGWIEAYARAWRVGDAEAVVALFAERCRYRSHPFREPEDAAAYTRREFAVERGQDVRFGSPVALGSRFAVEYWTTMQESGRDVTLAGCVMIRLDPEGRCEELRDYWAMQPGQIPPPPGWGE